MSKLSLFFIIFAGSLTARVYMEATYEETQSNFHRDKRQFSKKDSFKIRRQSRHYFEENNEPIQDGCQRDEARYIGDGQCYKLLTKGPCAIDEFLVLSRRNNSGVCEARLCLPDRIFIPDFQLCFDFRDPSLCPSGREPRVDPYGYPVWPMQIWHL
ncbi:uncharacterized protein LOC135205713 [Macrobrachium nipponense]|uniref:uncharacterized protein LOC135205713 n=1 Tax=Macrobrachium nipponense TaxID=159736 RepID=UPI0030C80D97